MTDSKILIENLDDLREEKKRLKAEIKMHKAGIGQSFTEMKEELNPLNFFSRKGDSGEEQRGGFKNLLNSAGSSPLISLGVSTAANFLLKKVFLRNAGFLPRLVFPFVIKKASDFIVAPKLNKKIVSAMHNTAETIRDADVKDVLPEAKDLVPQKALNAVAKTSEKIADKLYTTAEKIRPDDKPKPVYSSSLLKKNKPQRKIAKKLHKLAEAIRG